jgi:hypothetical protein
MEKFVVKFRLPATAQKYSNGKETHLHFSNSWTGSVILREKYGGGWESS